MKILRTDSSNSDFRKLCRELDNELNERYGRVQSTYDKQNVIEDNRTVIIGYLQEVPIAGGCFKQIDQDVIEIKRMFVAPSHRRKGLSSTVLAELEAWAKERGFSTAILETGKGQPEAIGLYRKAGYEVTDNYGPYVGIENSLCMRKILYTEALGIAFLAGLPNPVNCRTIESSSAAEGWSRGTFDSPIHKTKELRCAHTSNG